MSKKYYVVMAKDKETGEDRFYDIDNHSGGYPYWSYFPHLLCEKPDFEKVTIKNYFYGILHKVTDIRIAVVKFEHCEDIKGINEALNEVKRIEIEKKEKNLEEQIQTKQEELNALYGQKVQMIESALILRNKS